MASSIRRSRSTRRPTVLLQSDRGARRSEVRRRRRSARTVAGTGEAGGSGNVGRKCAIDCAIKVKRDSDATLN